MNDIIQNSGKNLRLVYIAKTSFFPIFVVVWLLVKEFVYVTKQFVQGSHDLRVTPLTKY